MTLALPVTVWIMELIPTQTKGSNKMNNAHIELVKKWLADNDSVSLEELKANSRAADAASETAAAAYDAAAAEGASYDAAASDASYWVKRYEELNKL
jgi:hypothetical protein